MRRGVPAPVLWFLGLADLDLALLDYLILMLVLRT